MENNSKIKKTLKSNFLILFLLMSFGTLCCNNPEKHEQQDERMHDEYMMEHEMPHNDMKEEDDQMMKEDTLHEEMTP